MLLFESYAIELVLEIHFLIQPILLTGHERREFHTRTERKKEWVDGNPISEVGAPAGIRSGGHQFDLLSIPPFPPFPSITRK